MQEAAIQIEHVTKSFAGTVAVNNINFSVEKGEFFTFLGPSGCGKTTLLRMIAGFETPSAGRILIAARDMIKIPPHKRPVNMVFQSYALFPHLTVLENICFGLRSSGKYPRSEASDRAKRTLSLVRLEHLCDRFPSQLSGGQQQRIALARAIVNEPAVLLLDEPLSALDPQIREEMQGELARLQRQLNMTFVMVTHDQSEALALSHRIAVFCAGNLEQLGTPQEVYAAPKTQFVAQFIGQSNLLPGAYLQTSRGLYTAKMADGTLLGVGAASELEFDAGAPCFLCVKPQSFTVQVLGPGDNIASVAAENKLAGRILYASYKGTSTEFFVQVGDLQLRADMPHRSAPPDLNVGENVILTFPPEAGWMLADRTQNAAEKADRREINSALVL